MLKNISHIDNFAQQAQSLQAFDFFSIRSTSQRQLAKRDQQLIKLDHNSSPHVNG